MSVLLPLLLKMVISALIVVLASLAVERTGPVAGMGGFTAGLCFLHLTAVPLGSVAALCGTLCVCVAWNIGLLLLQRRRVRQTQPSA